jgi:hypothetical protein
MGDTGDTARRTFAERFDHLIENTLVPGVGKGEGGRYSHGQIAREVKVSVTTVTNWRLGVTGGPGSRTRRRLEEFFGAPRYSLDDSDDDDDGEVQGDPQTVRLRVALDRPGVAALAMRLGDLETADLRWVEAILDARQRRTGGGSESR